MRRFVPVLAALVLVVAGTATAAAGNQSGGEITYQTISFENEGGTVYGTYTRPAKVSGNTPAVLMLHGFTGDRNEGPVFQPDGSFTDTMYSRTAQVLAENGFASLRIDFRGSGQSIEEMGFAETTFSGQASDASAAIEWLGDQKKIGPIGVLGLSQGGLVGAITAGGQPRRHLQDGARIRHGAGGSDPAVDTGHASLGSGDHARPSILRGAVHDRPDCSDLRL
jgi:pimeloyl-ACP methyl ester carboxylesterase